MLINRNSIAEWSGGHKLLDYNELACNWRKGIRNGNWRRLRILDRVFYRAAMFYARIKNVIVNNRIISELKNIVEMLRTSIRRKIMSVGAERAKEMLVRFEKSGVLGWVPQLRAWIKDERYIFWIGLSSQAPHNRWIK